MIEWLLDRSGKVPKLAGDQHVSYYNHESLKRLAESTAGSFQVAQGANGLPAAFRSITTGLFEPIYQIVILDPGQGLTGLSIHLGNSSPLTIELPAEASGA